jgi:hypothetical protein
MPSRPNPLLPDPCAPPDRPRDILSWPGLGATRLRLPGNAPVNEFDNRKNNDACTWLTEFCGGRCCVENELGGVSRGNSAPAGRPPGLPGWLPWRMLPWLPGRVCSWLGRPGPCMSDPFVGA